VRLGPDTLRQYLGPAAISLAVAAVVYVTTGGIAARQAAKATAAHESRIAALERQAAVSEALMARVERALEANRDTLTAVRVELAKERRP
jgi:ATP-dependent protease HslVU (ClpYQ) peptidase subunit